MAEMNPFLTAMLAHAAVLALLLATLAFFRERGRYRYERNPHRRHCIDCGQQQSRFGYWNDPDGPAWWEPMYEIKDPACRCHLDVPVRYRPDPADSA